MSKNNKISVLKMPSLSPTMSTGNLKQWIKKVGDNVKLGDVIAEVETDKATMEMESPDSGVLVKILIQNDTNDIAVDIPIGLLAKEKVTDEEIADFCSSLETHNSTQSTTVIDTNRVGGHRKASELQQANQQSVKTENIPVTPVKSERVKITPYAKNLAYTHNIDYSSLQGTGKDGFITATDIENHHQPSSLTQTVTSRIIALSPMRKAISNKVCYSKQTIPHFYVSAELDVTKMLEHKSELFQKYQIKTTINDWFILACSRALLKTPQLNQVWEKENETLVQKNTVDINCALDVGSGPLLVLLKSANTKGLLNIRDEMSEIVQKAKDAKITPAELETGTFSMSNLGMYKVSHFQAIINPPQVAVLAVGGTNAQGLCTVTLSCDHRALDGRDAALFLQELRQYVEAPILMLS